MSLVSGFPVLTIFLPLCHTHTDSFGPQRYQNILYNSYGHSTPYPAGTLQKDSTDAKAVPVKSETEGSVSTLVLDLSSAYPVSI